MAGDLQSTALQITYKGATLSLEALKNILAQILKPENKSSQPQKVEGEQSLKSLNRQGKQLESVSLSGEDIGSFRKQLKKYSVDFSIMKDTANSEYSVFFKGQDVDRIYKGLEACIENLSMDKGSKKPVKEVFENAYKKAAEQAQNKDSQSKDKQRERKDTQL